MAKVIANELIKALSGAVGGLAFRPMPDGSIVVSTAPHYGRRRKYSQGQKDHQSRFKRAAMYARYAAKVQPIYTELAKGTTKTAYNIAVADWFGEPQVLDIDITGWTGQTGQEIRVKAKDNVKVASVHVMIRESNSSATALEEGEAVPSDTDGLLWTYTTKTLVPMTPGTRLDVMAKDLPGNIGGSSLELN
jgi:hypothetical protein